MLSTGPNKPRRKFTRQVPSRLLMVSWIPPLVQSVVLPVHATTSVDSAPIPENTNILCAISNIMGRWRLELFGIAATVREINFRENDQVDDQVLNRWQLGENQIEITQGLTWVLTGIITNSAGECDSMEGTYTNTFIIPIAGNVVVRRGNWQATKLT